jgi:hypothetical protein
MSTGGTADLVWIPAVPLPFYGSRCLRRAHVCQCGARFTGKHRERDYRAHWRRRHDLEANRRGDPKMGVTREEAQAIYVEARRYGGDSG